MNKNKDKILEIAKKAFNDDKIVLAIETLKPYLKKNPMHAFAWYLLGDSLRIIGRYNEAKVALFKALKLDDKGGIGPIQSVIAHLYDAIGNYPEALVWYEKLGKNKEYASFGWYWIVKGGCYSKLNKFKKAEKCFRKSLTLNDVDIDEAYLNLGYVLRAQSKYKESLKMFKKVLTLDAKSQLAKEGIISLEGV